MSSKAFEKDIKLNTKEHGLYMTLLTQTCLINSMRRKHIDPLRNYYLINVLEKEERFNSKEYAAYFYTDMMAELQKRPTIVWQINMSRATTSLSINIKMDAIINVMLFELLTDNDCGYNGFPFISHLAEDLGVGSESSYYSMVTSADEKNKEFKHPANLSEYDESHRIMQDSLFRSNLIP